MLFLAENEIINCRPEDYNNPLDPKSRLKKDSIPSTTIFTFPPLSASTATKRKPSIERLALAKKVKFECGHSVNHDETVSKEEDLKGKLLTSRKKIRTLQQKIRWNDKKNRNIIGSYIGFKGVINLCRCFECT